LYKEFLVAFVVFRVSSPKPRYCEADIGCGWLSMN